MYKVLSLAALVGGVALLVYGIGASQSLSSDISRFFNGSPTDKAIWMLIGGAVLCIVGLAGMMRRSRAAS